MTVRPATGPAKPSSTPDDIVREIADRYCLTPDDITGPSRRQDIVEARSEAAYRLYFETDLRLTGIGEVLRRDHSSVSYLVRRHQLREEVAR